MSAALRYSPVQEEPQVPFVRRRKRKCNAYFCATHTAVVMCLLGLVAMGLAFYFSLQVCAKYPGWVNVKCNTTSFWMVNQPFSGITGFVTADYLNGTCHSPALQVFSCHDLNNLPACVAAGQLNFNTWNKIWPCYEATAICDPPDTVPVVQPPSHANEIGCVLSFVFFVICVAFIVIAPALCLLAQDSCDAND